MPAAYCGPAPQPNTLWTSWNLDPTALAISLALLVFWLKTRRGEGRHLAFGLSLWLALFLTPLCALTVALFSARVAHHVFVIGVVAPLLALAFPAMTGKPRRVSLAALVAVHAVTVWFWHAPLVYAAAVFDAATYWAMQLTLLGTAFMLWRRILAADTALGASLIALLATLVQMGMLGALLTFAGAPLYAPHLTTAEPFGLMPLADQQLGGLIMWVPAAIPYLVAAALLLGRRLRDEVPAAARP